MEKSSSCICTGDGVVVVPSETAAVYNEIKSDSEYAAKRARIDVMDEYLMSCVNLYRAIDITTFLSILMVRQE